MDVRVAFPLVPPLFDFNVSDLLSQLLLIAQATVINMIDSLIHLFVLRIEVLSNRTEFTIIDTTIF